MISSSALAHALIDLGHTHGVEEGSRMFFDFIQKNRLEGLLPNVEHRLDELMRSAQKENMVEVTTSHDVDQELLRKIKASVKASESSELSAHIDRDILGGYIARYNNTLYDASFKTAIHKLGRLLKSQ